MWKSELMNPVTVTHCGLIFGRSSHYFHWNSNVDITIMVLPCHRIQQNKNAYFLWRIDHSGKQFLFSGQDMSFSSMTLISHERILPEVASHISCEALCLPYWHKEILLNWRFSADILSIEYPMQCMLKQRHWILTLLLNCLRLWWMLPIEEHFGLVYKCMKRGYLACKDVCSDFSAKSYSGS